ncbi:alpha/beta fold hydrolase [Ginsengibacter hankyongi]|uniref:alpha/beta fold hydrolase n=1 Tax=Ginsengibacter hankyongi TaxID=2607284 RepID=UPI001925EF51|nr:alpha/beta hydrolase [Ginsengibacter hankyongi]
MNDAVLYYYIYGSGKPIIILSGGPGQASHAEDDVALALSKKYQAILFDQRGTGKSWTKPMDSSTINIEQAIEDIELLRKHLKVLKLNMYGHSWGSMLGAAYIACYPGNVQSFISVDGGPLDSSMASAVQINFDSKNQLCDTSQYDYWSRPDIIKRDSLKAKYELEKIVMAPLLYDTSNWNKVFLQRRKGNRNDLMHELMLTSFSKKFIPIEKDRKYHGASLIVFGFNDPIGLTTLSQYLRAFPKAIVAGIYQSGHFPEIEQSKHFYEIINAFLENNTN